MNRDKQIEKMAKDLCHTDTCEIKKIGIPCNHRCKAHIYATRAIDKGYRKASEVAREIIQDIIEPIWEAYQNSENEMTSLLAAFICECISTKLKKKYTEGSDAK